ncbi:MAG: GbsR/MarR family transcriptional regulator [Rubrobacter sp.]
MNEEKLAYVEDFGEFFEGFGVGRMLGRVLGVLLVSDPPERTAEELAGILKASRGSISAATRSLVQLGVVERRSKLGDRKAYFRSTPDWRELMWRQIGVYAAFRRLAERGLGLMEGSSPESRLDLEGIRSLYAHLEREMPRVIADWERGREEETTS